MMLRLLLSLPIMALQGGWFVSRGVGIHADRHLDSYELILVRSGVLAIQEEEHAFDVAAGQTLLLFAGRRHFGTRPYAPDLSFYWCHFSVAGETDSGDFAIPQHVSLPRPDDAAELFRRFLNGQEAGTLSSRSANLLLMLLLAEVAAAGERAEIESREASGAVTRANAFIRTQFDRAISAADVATHLGYNPDYLGRLYRQARGRTLNEAIEEQRLLQARRLLLDSSANVDEIARQSGFTDANYFRRRFKRREGVSPGAFRRLHARAFINTE